MAWDLLELLAVGQVVEDLGVALQLPNDLLEREVLVEGDSDVSHMTHIDATIGQLLAKLRTYNFFWPPMTAFKK